MNFETNKEKVKWWNYSKKILDNSWKSNRKKTRKILFQELFASTFQLNDKNYFYSSFFDDVFSFKRDDEYLDEIIKIIFYYEYFFINIIQKYSPRFDIEKMNIINIIPIYIALAEMFYLKEEIPAKVSINEAVEIAKVYWDDSSKKIVNWVLNKVLENYEDLKEIKNTLDKKDFNYSIFKK